MVTVTVMVIDVLLVPGWLLLGVRREASTSSDIPVCSSM